MADDEGKPEPKEVRGVTEADYQRWRHNPVTQWFLQYLRDYRADLITDATERWLADALTLSSEHEQKGFIRCLEQTVTLPFASVATFYAHIDELQTEHATEEEDDARQTAADDAG